MCITIIGRVLKASGKTGVVEVEGTKRNMNLSLVDVKPGDFVSCALDLAVEKLDAQEAMAIIGARRDARESDRLLFLKYAVPCATTLVKRNTLAQKDYDSLLAGIINGKLPQGEPEKIFKVAFAMCSATALKNGGQIGAKIIRDYFWFGHDAVVDERFEAMRDFDPVHCKTYPARVTKVRGAIATVETSVGKQECRTDFTPAIKPGSCVVVHRGYVVEEIAEGDFEDFAQRAGKRF